MAIVGETSQRCCSVTLVHFMKNEMYGSDIHFFFAVFCLLKPRVVGMEIVTRSQKKKANFLLKVFVCIISVKHLCMKLVRSKIRCKSRKLLIFMLKNQMTG